jgi:hypothetical protein
LRARDGVLGALAFGDGGIGDLGFFFLAGSHRLVRCKANPETPAKAEPGTGVSKLKENNAGELEATSGNQGLS